MKWKTISEFQGKLNRIKSSQRDEAQTRFITFGFF